MEVLMKSKKMAKALHHKIVEARDAAGFSITEAAQKLGFKNYQTLSSIEKGTRNITANELIEMARLYGRTLDYFFESVFSPEPSPLWRKIEKRNVKQVQRQFLLFLEQYSNMEHLLALKRRWTEIRSPFDRNDFTNNGFEVADNLKRIGPTALIPIIGISGIFEIENTFRDTIFLKDFCHMFNKPFNPFELIDKIEKTFLKN